MRLIGNILWHIPFMGFLGAICAFLIGIALTLLVFTAPIGLGLIQYAKFLMIPYSYEIISSSELNEYESPIWNSYSLLLRILYFPIGLVLAAFQLCQIIGLFCSIVGIPVAIPLARSLHVYLNPVGKICIDRDMAQFIKTKRGI